MLLVINSLEDGHIHMDMHTYTNATTHTHIPTSHTKAFLGNQLCVPTRYVSIILQ